MTARALALPDGDRGAEFVRWGLAAAIVCAAHFGLAAGYWLLPEPEAEGAAGAPVVIVELAPLPVAPASQQDLAPGPDMVEAQPAPTPPQQIQAQEEAQPIPKMEEPAEVTLPEPAPKPVEQKPEEVVEAPKVETPPAPDAAPAPQTTAAPRSEQQTAAAPAAPSPGSVSNRAIASWRDLLLLRLQQSKRYPATAEARREQGIVTLSFTVDRAGHVLARSIAKSSGVAALDEEVLAMVKRAEPLPAFPPAMTQDKVNLVVPIRFSLR